MEKLKESEERKKFFTALAFGLLLSGVFMLILSGSVFAQPEGPSEVTSVDNQTKSTNPAFEINISGGVISIINITAVTQNLRWKAFVGNVTGKFTLDDSGGSTIYDWDLASVSGEIYATRNSSTITWSGIGCANSTEIENENIAMNHTNAQDNLTITFSSVNHSGFFVGAVPIPQDTCFSLNTYVNDAAQSDVFDEVALADADSNIIYATVLEDAEAGFDGSAYDFQMIVPEFGTPGFGGSTAYYLYVQLI